ncbi:MAG TPA: hypothetical protein VL961_05405 [Acidimicrobiales bacterium]|nr:hypothetical protein [Acidimicrobiales bacterium]
MTEAGQDLHTTFAGDEALDALWTKAYQGEVLGEALFAGMADSCEPTERARKLRVLAEVERRTREAMVPAMQRAGLSTAADPEAVHNGELLAEGSRALPWADFMASFEPITTEFLAVYTRIGELDPSERETADLLVAHERALQDFARAELAGESEHSVEVLEALPHMR